METSSSLNKKFEKIRACVFDFDGTIYPGFIIADAALKYFMEKDRRKLEELKKLFLSYKKMPFEEVIITFCELIEGVSCEELDSICKSLLSSCYSSFPLVVEKLHSLRLKCYVSSLTSQFVAQEVCKRFNLDGYTFFKYPVKNIGGMKVFSVLLPRTVKTLDLSTFKLDALRAGSFSEKNFLAAGDSTQDLCLFNEAIIRVGINPDPKLANYSFDVIIRNKVDPWKEFLLLLH